MESDNPATPSSARPIDLAVSSSIPLNMEEYQSIEGRAQELLDGWQLAVSTLGGRMEQLLGTIQQGQSIYSDTVDELTQSMSQCLQDTTFMIACCDELDKDFAQVKQLAVHIKDIDQRLARILEKLQTTPPAQT